jgi:Cu/Ag efflux pump CusA
MLLVLAFGKARDAILVMVNLPLALIGGVAGVFLAGGVLSVASMIGFITLFGIATRNGIMLVSHIQHLMTEEGVTDFRAAVERGAHERLVPILMTAMAAGTGTHSLLRLEAASPAARFRRRWRSSSSAV